MANIKGSKKTGGRQKGTQNKVTKDLKPILQTLLQKELKNLPQLITQLEPKERVDAITKLLPYIIPKMKQVDNVNNEAIEPLEIIIVRPERSNILVDGKNVKEVEEFRKAKELIDSIADEDNLS